MVEDIKSSDFFIKLFVYVEEKQKLKIIKYNKMLQNNINISIINYKNYKGKYIVDDSNGILKEYDGYDNALIFEGEFTDGDRNGKGKEYYNDGKIRFVGKYLNGKKNGIGKEYDYDNRLIFEGEYFNDEKNGRGKEYNNGKLSFEGIFLNNKNWVGTKYDKNGNIMYSLNNNVNGSGKEYYFDGILRYEGEYINGKRNGKGVEYYMNGNKLFEGDYLNDLKWNGKGYDSLNNLVYELKDGKCFVKEFNGHDDTLSFEGEYLNGERNGRGKEYDYFDGNLVFEGEYSRGQRNGKGKQYNKGKLEYEGEYLNGKKHGKGKEYYSDGKLRFDGEYLYDSKIRGKYYVNDILEYLGEYLYNRKWDGSGFDEKGIIIYVLKQGDGEVKEYDDNGKLKFKGKYLNGCRNGEGKEYFENGNVEFEGDYLNGKRNGKGKEYYIFGILEFEGNYLNGKRHGIGKEYYSDGHLKFQGEFVDGIRKPNKIILESI